MAPKLCLNGFKMASWSPLGASWPLEALLEPSWRALGGLLAALGVVLEASWALLGRSWRRLGRSWSGLGRSWARLGGQKAPEIDAKRVQHGVEEAMRTENAIS